MKTIIYFQFFVFILHFIQFELNFSLVTPSASPFAISATCSALSVHLFSSDFFIKVNENIRKVCSFSGWGIFFSGMMAAAYIKTAC